MAIAFQYQWPNGYQPVPDNVPHNNANSNNGTDRNNNRVVGGGGQNGQSFVNHGEQLNEVEQRNVEVDERISFVRQFVREMCLIFGVFPENQNQANVTPMTSVASPVTRRPEMQDNQRRGRRTSTLLSRESSTSSLGPLPDIIQCHGASFSIGLSFESRTMATSPYSGTMSSTTTISSMNPSAQSPASTSMIINQDDSLEDAVAVEVAGSAGGSESSEEESEESWSLELKLAIGPWRQVGRDLRRVADQLQLESSTRRRTSPRRRSLEFNLAVKMAVPTLALMGLGVAFIRRHL